MTIPAPTDGFCSICEAHEADVVPCAVCGELVCLEVRIETPDGPICEEDFQL